MFLQWSTATTTGTKLLLLTVTTVALKYESYATFNDIHIDTLGLEQRDKGMNKMMGIKWQLTRVSKNMKDESVVDTAMQFLSKTENLDWFDGSTDYL